LLELQCVLLPRRLRHIRYPFALEQLAKSDVLQGQGQTALQEIAQNTWDTIQGMNSDGSEYQPSQKYASQEYVHLSLNSELAVRMRNLHTSVNLTLDSNALEDPSSLFCYFAQFVDLQGRRLTGIRRASQFKGIVKSRLIQFISDALKLVVDNTFKLDRDFDMLIDSSRVHILRPSGFEIVGKLQESICAAVPGNIATIQQEMTFVDFACIQAYAESHPRAARYLASIRSQRETQNISAERLKHVCITHGIQLEEEADGRIIVRPGSELDFLNVLDRRLYELELVEGQPERYKASSRQKVGD
jgi:very-short-patch-repair endonuclease